MTFPSSIVMWSFQSSSFNHYCKNLSVMFLFSQIPFSCSVFICKSAGLTPSIWRPRLHAGMTMCPFTTGRTLWPPCWESFVEQPSHQICALLATSCSLSSSLMTMWMGLAGELLTQKLLVRRDLLNVTHKKLSGHKVNQRILARPEVNQHIIFEDVWLASYFFCRPCTRMWWLSLNANGHGWVTRSKPGRTLWTQHELCMEHRNASKPGHQSDFLVIWAGEFRYVPLRLRQSKLPFINYALYICHWDHSNTKNV